MIPSTHPGRATRAGATTLASRCGAPNAIPDAVQRPADGRWVPVVRLRLDQLWLRPHVEERGVLCLLVDEIPIWD